MSDDTELGEVVPIGATPKPTDQRGLRLVRYQHGACDHRTCTYIVDEKLAEVQCGDCGAKLEPVWVLRQLCEKEARWNERRKEFLELQEETRGRTRTRCQHCDQMTAINISGRLSRVAGQL
jgi:hypothetical protein